MTMPLVLPVVERSMVGAVIAPLSAILPAADSENVPPTAVAPTFIAPLPLMYAEEPECESVVTIVPVEAAAMVMGSLEVPMLPPAVPVVKEMVVGADSVPCRLSNRARC